MTDESSLVPHELGAATNEDRDSEFLFVAASNSWGTLSTLTA